MKRCIRYFGLFACVSGILGPGLAEAARHTADPTLARAKLAEVRGKIAAMTRRIGSELEERDALGARLREADLRITAKRRELDDLHAEQTAAQRRKSELRAEQSQVQRSLDAERAGLAAQMRAAYMMGREQHIKFLLNQSDPSSAARMAAFYGYFVQQQAQRIAQIDARMSRLQEVAGQLDKAVEQLQNLRNHVQRDIEELQQARDERRAALAAVAKQMDSGNQQLVRLRREEQAEEVLLADLARVLQDFPADTQQSFEELRGRLPWPVPGRLAAGYQERRSAPASTSKWNGVLIEAARGAKVSAPCFGRVVYADWLQGLGLLLILAHSGSYMTLYGHAEVLYKSVGDWVAPGEVIAALSESSGTLPQLYFEIREGRAAEDPKAWLKAKP